MRKVQGLLWSWGEGLLLFICSLVMFNSRLRRKVQGNPQVNIVDVHGTGIGGRLPEHRFRVHEYVFLYGNFYRDIKNFKRKY